MISSDLGFFQNLEQTNKQTNNYGYEGRGLPHYQSA